MNTFVCSNGAAYVEGGKDSPQQLCQQLLFSAPDLLTCHAAGRT